MHTFSEWVLPGHPDKICDRIADALVDAALALDPRALAGIEVAVHRNHVFVDGRIAAPGADQIAVTDIVRSVFCDLGYGGRFAPDPDTLTIATDLCIGDFRPDERLIRSISDDQNVVTGFAEWNPATNHLPAAPFVARVIGEEFDRARDNRSEDFGPDGKVLVVLSDDAKYRLEAVSFSVHHSEDVGTIEIVAFAKAVLTAALAKLPWVSAEWTDGKTEVLVNGAGDFAVGGPEGDNGLSGKKLVVDHYGPHIPIGGGALSGKDPHKVDRASALRARQIAKHLVLSGSATSALVHLAFAPGDEAPRWVEIQTDGVSNPALAARWLPAYDLTLDGTFRDLDLGRIRWQELATHGHFFDPVLPWERWNPGKP